MPGHVRRHAPLRLGSFQLSNQPVVDETGNPEVVLLDEHQMTVAVDPDVRQVEQIAPHAGLCHVLARAVVVRRVIRRLGEHEQEVQSRQPRKLARRLGLKPARLQRRPVGLCLLNNLDFRRIADRRIVSQRTLRRSIRHRPNARAVGGERRTGRLNGDHGLDELGSHVGDSPHCGPRLRMLDQDRGTKLVEQRQPGFYRVVLLVVDAWHQVRVVLLEERVAVQPVPGHCVCRNACGHWVVRLPFSDADHRSSADLTVVGLGRGPYAAT